MTAPVSNQTLWNRAKGLYWGLSFPLRMLATAIVAGLAIAPIYMALMPGRPELAYLMGGQELKATQLQSICQALDAEGLSGYQVDGLRLKVPREHFTQYVAAIAKREPAGTGFYAAFDRAAEQASWLSSGAQDERRWELAKQKSLAQSIEQMPEVESASVLIDRAAARGLRSSSDVRSTVTVKPRPGQELAPFRIRQIRTLVAGAVAGLAPENVAVVDLNGRTLLELGSNGSGSDDLLMRMKEFEEHYSWKIRNVLAYLPDAVVTVSVELETTRQRRTEQIVHPAHEEPGGELHKGDSDTKPTVTANAASELDAADAVAAEPAPTQQTWEEHVALGPKSVTVSVSVPQDIVDMLGASNSNASESSNWSEPIRQRVANAIPTGVTASIAVTSYPRAVERQPVAASASSPATPWLPWIVVLGASVTVALGSWVRLHWHQLRGRHDRVAPAHSRQEMRAGRDSGLSIGSSPGGRRELIRVERDVSRDGRGPHLMQARICSFEDLRWLAPSSLQAVLGAVDGRLWAPALRGASRRLSDRILAHMPARAAALLRDEIEYPGPVRLGDVEAAQQEILETVRRLDHTGDLVLEDREEILHE